MSTEPAVVVSEAEIASRVRRAAAAAREKKALDLRILDVAEVSDFTDYLVICGGSSDRQVQAIADAVEQQLRPERVRPLSIEGYNLGRWILLDFGDFVVHVFDEEAREYYRLERLWADAPDVTRSLGA